MAYSEWRKVQYRGHTLMSRPTIVYDNVMLFRYNSIGLPSVTVNHFVDLSYALHLEVPLSIVYLHASIQIYDQ